MTNVDCKARIIGDQYVCDLCVMCWDLNDDTPPCQPPPVVREVDPRQALRDLIDNL